MADTEPCRAPGFGVIYMLGATRYRVCAVVCSALHACADSSLVMSQTTDALGRNTEADTRTVNKPAAAGEEPSQILGAVDTSPAASQTERAQPLQSLLRSVVFCASLC